MLQDDSPEELLRTVHSRRQTGVMRLRGDVGKATLWFREGELIDGASGKLEGVQAVFRAMRFAKGSYVVELGADADRAARIDAPLSSLISEGTRRAKQCRELVDRLPPLGQLLMVNDGRVGPLDEEQRQLLQLFDPHCSIDEALDLSPAGEVETLTLLEQLVDAHILEAASGKRRYSPDEVTAEIELPPARPLGKPTPLPPERPRMPRHEYDEEDTAVKRIPKRPSTPVPEPERPSAPQPERASAPQPEPERPSPPQPEPDDEPTAVKDFPKFAKPAELRALVEELTGRPELDAPSYDDQPSPLSRSSEAPVSELSVSVPPPPKRRWGLWIGLLVAAVVAVAWFQMRSEIGDWFSSVSRGPERSPPVTAVSAVVPPKPVPPCSGDMVHVQAGRFKMGSNSDHPLLASSVPAHRVDVKAYCIDRTEVTAEAYAGCVRRGKCTEAAREAEWPKPRRHTKAMWKKSRKRHSEQCNAGKAGRKTHPINCVTWRQSLGYCKARDARLPTEAEWEYAARGKAERLYPWGSGPPTPDRLNGCGVECDRWHERAGLDRELDGVMYDADDGYADTAPVGSFLLGATKSGLVDMSGNVSEWTAGAYEPYAKTDAGADEDSKLELRAVRGAAFNSDAPELAVASLRRPVPTEVRVPSIGFRCAADVRK